MASTNSEQPGPSSSIKQLSMISRSCRDQRRRARIRCQFSSEKGRGLAHHTDRCHESKVAVSSASMMLFAFSDPSDPALKRVAAFFTSANASMMPAGWVVENSGRLTRTGREAGANASAPVSTRRSADPVRIFLQLSRVDPSSWLRFGNHGGLSPPPAASGPTRPEKRGFVCS